MGVPAAKQGDRITALDTHIVLVPSGSGATATPLPHPFAGSISGGVSSNVKIMGLPAATVESTATNIPPHLPTSPGTAFEKPPTNRATIVGGSSTVRINGKAAARAGDRAATCNDPVDVPAGMILATGTVFIG